MKSKAQPTKAEKVLTVPQHSKKVQKAIERKEKFDAIDSSNWERLLATASGVVLENMGLNKMIRTFLQVGENILTDGQRAVLTFDNVKNYIARSKYKDLVYFSEHQMKLICSAVIRENHKATRQAERATKQGAIVGKKAEKLAPTKAKKEIVAKVD